MAAKCLTCLQTGQDLGKLEEEGAKADVKRKVRTAAESEMTKIRKRFDAEIAKRVAVFDRFRNLKVQDLEGDDALSDVTYGDHVLAQYQARVNEAAMKLKAQR